MTAVYVSNMVQCVAGNFQYLKAHTQHFQAVTGCQPSGNPIDGGIVRTVNHWLAMGTERVHPAHVVKVVMRDKDAG